MKKDKKCRTCNIFLDINNCTYYRLRNYIYLCNTCDREDKRKWAEEDRKKNREKHNLRSFNFSKKLAYENPIKYKCQQMYSSSKKRAKIMNIPHDINTKYLLSIVPKYCPALKIKINFSSKKKEKSSPSLDRKCPLKGYIKGNVQIISYLANLMKSYANEEDLINFAKWVLKA